MFSFRLLGLPGLGGLWAFPVKGRGVYMAEAELMGCWGYRAFGVLGFMGLAFVSFGFGFQV